MFDRIKMTYVNFDYLNENYRRKNRYISIFRISHTTNTYKCHVKISIKIL